MGSVDSGGSEAGGPGPGAGPVTDQSEPSMRLTDQSQAGGHKTKYRVLVMGSARVGKTSIISQFLYDQFSSKYKVGK